jgi:hypothetical protein
MLIPVFKPPVDCTDQVKLAGDDEAEFSLTTVYLKCSNTRSEAELFLMNKSTTLKNVLMKILNF